MSDKTAFLLELMDKLGAPLAAALPAGEGGEDPVRAAEAMAALVSASIRTGIDLFQALHFGKSEGDPEALRVALTVLAGQLAAGQYRRSGKMPGDEERERTVKAMEAVIAFADKFAPAAEHAPRLKTLGGQPPLIDEAQTSLMTLQAAVPVIDAIAEFPFGQTETQLAQDVMDKLAARADTIAKDLKGESGRPAARWASLRVLQGLGQLYAAVHRAETARLQSAGEGGDPAAALERVWAQLDTRIGMVETLLLGARAQNDVNAAQPEAPEPAQAAPQPAPPPPPPAAAAGGGSPMSFFSKGGAPDAPAPEPQEGESGEDDTAQGGGGGGGKAPDAPAPPTQPSSPMGFFKPGGKPGGM